MEQKVIIAVKNRTTAFKLSKILNMNNINNKLMNTPEVARIACGLSVMIDAEDMNEAKHLAQTNGIRILGIFSCKIVNGRRLITRIR